MKLKKTTEGWILTEGTEEKAFESAHDAWMYIFLMKEIRQSATRLPKTLYPVRTLAPRPKVVKRNVWSVG